MIVHEVTAAFGSCWFVLYVVPSPLALRQRRSLRSFWFGVSFVQLMDDDLKFEYQDEPYEFVPNVRVGIRRLLTVPAEPAAPRYSFIVVSRILEAILNSIHFISGTTRAHGFLAEV